MGSTAEAKKTFETLLAINPAVAGGLNGLGQIYLSQRKYDEAETYLLKVLKVVPSRRPLPGTGSPGSTCSKENTTRPKKWAQKLVNSGQGDDVAKQMLQAAKDKRLGDELRQIIEPPPSDSDAGDEPREKK